ncbi:ABC transporter permease [Lachnospiraceae bacterium 29-91]
MGILRSIGLTGKQLCRMNIVDGMCYAFFAVLAVFIVGVPVSVVICMEVSKKSFAGKIVPYQFPFLEMGLFILVLFGMELILSGRSAGRKNNLWQSRFISIYDIIMHFTLLFTPFGCSSNRIQPIEKSPDGEGLDACPITELAGRRAAGCTMPCEQ